MSDDILYLDTESTTFKKGHPFSIPNRLMCVGTLFNGVSTYYDIEHFGQPYRDNLDRLQAQYQQARLIVAFNAKFDLHWLRLYLPELPLRPVWDCQLAEFFLSHQQRSYPSLDDTLGRLGLPPKLDVVKTNYWDHGIDTDQVPAEVLRDYVLGDIISLPAIYANQQQGLTPQQRSLLRLQMDDLLTLQEMEFNGLPYDAAKAQELGAKAHEEMDQLLYELNAIVGNTAVNWNSGHHRSAVLYGGGINYVGRELVLKTLKSGKVKAVERNCPKQIEFPARVAPLPRTEYSETATLSDDALNRTNAERKSQRKPKLYRVWSTDEATLKTLRPRHKSTRRIIELLLQLATLEKLTGTYYDGISKLMTEMQWRDGLIHGQLSQCVAITGRLASSRPNLQNFDNLIKPLFYSRYPT